MKIVSTELQLTSQHAAVREHSVSESLRLWQGEAPAQAPGGGRRGDAVQISQAAREALERDRTEGAKAVDAEDEGMVGDTRYLVLKMVVEAMTGRKIDLLRMEDLQPGAPSLRVPDAAPAGVGFEYRRVEREYEAEATAFAAQGVVRTADGREIAFQLEFAMQREWRHEEEISVRAEAPEAPRKKDPLVINLDGVAARLSDVRFAFDLDADGSQEQINFVAQGSGFLALDKNGDGRINDGSELFGPRSGDGFKDLAAYDQDGNAWIDEADAVFKELRIWTRDAEGNDRLLGLAEAGVGAISLARVATPFELKDAANTLQGEVRSSGVYLMESGGAGSIQQIDLVA